MAKTSATDRRGSRGRPKGPRKVPFLVRLPPEQKQDLDFLHDVMEGRPPVNGLIEEAIKQYVGRKLQVSEIRAEYERRAGPPALRVVRSPKKG